MTNISITLNDQEQQGYLGLIDAALKQAGIGALDAAAHFKVKLAQAQKDAQQAAPTRNVVDIKQDAAA